MPGAVARNCTKNGHSSRADAVSMGPSALDRKNGTAQSSVRSCYSTRALYCEPRRWHHPQTRVSQAGLTPLCGRLRRLHSQVDVAWRAWLV